MIENSHAATLPVLGTAICLVLFLGLFARTI